ncbi:hypothetical protein, partial [Thermaurantimonas sp.]|uniref:hypothetical protein n=1 Tax=Thermaurantimonas sp. TaxID=2681568 RepID=UPI00391BAA41
MPANAVSSCMNGCRHSVVCTTKTRIKTLPAKTGGRIHPPPAMYLPLKQGLRPFLQKLEEEYIHLPPCIF